MNQVHYQIEPYKIGFEIALYLMLVILALLTFWLLPSYLLVEQPCPSILTQKFQPQTLLQLVLQTGFQKYYYELLQPHYIQPEGHAYTLLHDIPSGYADAS